MRCLNILLVLSACSPPKPLPVRGTLFGVAKNRCVIAALSGGDPVSAVWAECTPASPLDGVPGRSDDGWFVAFTDTNSGQRKLFDPSGRVLATGNSSLTAFTGYGGRWYATAATTLEVFDGTSFGPAQPTPVGTSYFDIGSNGAALLSLEMDASRRLAIREHLLRADSLVAGRVVELPQHGEAVRIAETDATSVLLTERTRSLWARVGLDGSSTGAWVAGTQGCLGGNAFHVLAAPLVQRFFDGASSQASLPPTDGILCTCDPERVLLLRGSSLSSFDWRTQVETAISSDVSLTYRMLLTCSP